MNNSKHIASQRIDPSDIQQSFEQIQIQIHCCRYWKFSRWNSSSLAAPFWRLYHNELDGAIVNFENKEVQLRSNIILIIPPNTTFSISTKFHNNSKEEITGSRITKTDQLHDFSKQGLIDHFFIHFSLGFTYDRTESAFRIIEVNQEVLNIIAEIKKHLQTNFQSMPLPITAKIQSLTLWAISKTELEEWQSYNFDTRIIKAMKYIEQGLGGTLKNSEIAELCNMASNSFARLFKMETKFTVQEFIQKKRIEKALSLLHHSNAKIETIAEECGFYDAHHFSKVFKKEIQVAPSIYKKQSTMS